MFSHFTVMSAIILCIVGIYFFFKTLDKVIARRARKAEGKE